MIRIIKAPLSRGGLLPIAEVATIMNRGLVTIQRRISQCQKGKGEVLPLKENILDQDSSLTHKGIIIQLYERKIAPPDIARQIRHSLEVVDRYIF